MHKNTLLAILQQSEYDLPRWRKWIKDHQTDTPDVQPADWTPKLKLIRALSQSLFFLPVVVSIQLAVQLMTPIEQVIRGWYAWRAGTTLAGARRRGLKVIAVAGSYAKTSTKHILTHALGGTHQILMTPKSINTPLGIAQVILKELQPSHTLFIVELGEYRRHDIARLCRFLKPDLGILTPIGHQHVEILGSFEAIVTELSDFPAYFNYQTDRLVVSDHNRSYFADHSLTYYGVDHQADYQVTTAQVTKAGTEYQVRLPKSDDQPTELKVFSPLFGEHQAINSLTAFWLADQLGVPRTDIKKRLSSLPYIYRRHEPTFALNDVLILDNSYNTNADSVSESLKLLNQLQPSQRFFITLGFTELGDQASQVNYQLGHQLANQVDYLGLIQAPWTDDIIRGFVEHGGRQDHVVIGATQEAAFQQLQSFVKPGSVILFEGGYQEVYI